MFQFEVKVDDETYTFQFQRETVRHPIRKECTGCHRARKIMLPRDTVRCDLFGEGMLHLRQTRAICNPHDEFDITLGRRKALARILKRARGLFPRAARIAVMQRYEEVTTPRPRAKPAEVAHG